MQVNIAHEELTKFRFLGADDTFSQIILTVTFSELEKHSIIAGRIGDVIIMERTPSAEMGGQKHSKWYITFGYLLDLQINQRSDTYCVISPVDARIYEEQLREVLDLAKLYMDGNRSIEGLPSSFRL